MKYIKLFLIAILTCFAFTLFSQNVIFRQTDADRKFEIPKHGANRAQFSWIGFSLFGTDLAFGNSYSSRQRFGNYYGLNWNRKYRINRFLSHGFGLGGHRQVHTLNERGLNLIHPEEHWENGRLIYWGVNANYFLRFNFKPNRGDILGVYADLLLFGQYNPYQRARLTSGNLTYTYSSRYFAERIAAGVEIRIGYEHLSLYVRHNFFSGNRPNENLPFGDLNLTRWSIGLNIGFGLN
ncbi:MAG: hypothetical protein FWD02_05555 [Bacteroidales bacterium]|nr:hypothetical protein [Bacteroidales bacterium]